MKIGGHGIGINIHGCQPNLEMVIYVLKSALRYILSGTVRTRKFGTATLLLRDFQVLTSFF